MATYFRKIVVIALIGAFVGSSLYIPGARAGEVVVPIMPKPGTMVGLSPSFTPAQLKGISIHPDNALKFDFIIARGDGNLTEDQKPKVDALFAELENDEDVIAVHTSANL